MKKLSTILEKERDYDDFQKIKRYANHDLMDELSHHYYKAFNKNTPEERHSVREYTGIGSEAINTYLWDKHHNNAHNYDEEATGFFNNHIDRIQHFLHSHKTPRAFSVYSGLKNKPTPNEKGIYHHPGFMSSSIHLNRAKAFLGSQTDKSGRHEHLLHVHVPEGHVGAYVAPISKSANEGEFLFPHSSNFKHLHTHTYRQKIYHSADREHSLYMHVHHVVPV